MRQILLGAIAVVTMSVACVAQGASTNSNNNSDLASLLVRTEEQIHAAVKSNDKRAFDMILPAKSYALDDVGLKDKPTLIQQVFSRSCDIKSFSMEETRVIPVNHGAVVLTYKSAVDGSCNGRPIPTVYVSTLYVKQKGKWKPLFHQVTSAK